MLPEIVLSTPRSSYTVKNCRRDNEDNSWRRSRSNGWPRAAKIFGVYPGKRSHYPYSKKINVPSNWRIFKAKLIHAAPSTICLFDETLPSATSRLINATIDVSTVLMFHSKAYQAVLRAFFLTRRPGRPLRRFHCGTRCSITKLRVTSSRCIA